MNYLFIAFDWTIIILSYALFLKYPGVFSFLFLVIMIAGRQHAFFANQHEASHGHLHCNPFLNEWISTLFCSLPMGHNYFYFKQYHLLHHRFLNSDLDPSYVPIKNDPNWVFPMEKKKFILLCLKDFLGMNYDVMTFYETLYSRHSRSYRYFIDRYSYYLLSTGVFFLFTKDFSLSLFCTLAWFIAKYTVLIWLIRMRTIVEHSGNIPDNNQSRDVIGSFWERFFIIPHNVGLHYLHHKWPQIPAWKLRRADAPVITERIFGSQGLMKSLLK